MEYFLKYGIPILLAFIAGFIALLQVRINVFAKARIEWIHGLRENVVNLIVKTNELVYVYKLINDKLEKGENSSIEDDNRKNLLICDIEKAATLIELFLNPIEPEHIELSNYVNQIEEILPCPGKESSYSATKYNNLIKKITANSQIVLKTAWRDAKSFKKNIM